jgi:peptide-methionine (R)-S-oxide reductase
MSKGASNGSLHLPAADFFFFGALVMKRRTFFGLFGIGAAASLGTRAAGAPADLKPIVDMQNRWQSFLSPNAKFDLSRTPIKRSAAEWKKLLTPEQFHVLREEGTERAGTSPLNAEKRPGLFVCAGCSLPLFTSEMKYESGTGWPSFFTTIPDVFGTKKDFVLLLPRTEYHCIRCGSHHGHVFDDGPRPTGLRYCNNGVALRFVPKG